jgi:hypothetical protein
VGANLPLRMAQRQAVELCDAVRDEIARLQRKYERRGFSPEAVARELEHALRQLAVQYAPARLPR